MARAIETAHEVLLLPKGVSEANHSLSLHILLIRFFLYSERFFLAESIEYNQDYSID